MPVTINGTTGVAGVDGSASTPAVQGSDTNTGEFFPAADTIAWTTGGSERMRVDSSGNVGVGTSSPGRLLSLYATQPVFQITNVASGSAAGNGTIQYQVSGSTDFVLDNQGSGSGGVIRWMQAGSERMRIDSNGKIMVNTTTNWSSGNFVVSANSATNNAMVCQDTSTTYGAGVYFATYVNSTGALAGYVAHTGATTVNFGSVSDYRLKEDVAPITNSLDKICQLKPVSYNWKEDKSYGEGFIAHELQEIIPLAVDGIKDALDKDGNIKPQGVDQSKIVVHLVAAIQELSAKVDAQAAEIAALKANAPA